MPFITKETTLEMSNPQNKLPEDNKQDLGFIDVIGDAFHIDNPIVALFKNKDRSVDPTSKFNIKERLDEDEIDINLFDQFVYVDNEEEYQEVLLNNAKDLESRQRISEAGISGLMASMLAGSVSPSLFIGGGSLIQSLKAGNKAWKAGAITGSVVSATIYGEEKLLQGTQSGRTDEEVMLNTAAGFLLAGLVGAGASKLSNAKMEKLAGDIKQGLAVHEEIQGLPTTLSEMAEFDKSVGAAMTPLQERFAEQGLSALSKEQLGAAKTGNQLWNKVIDGYLAINKKFNPAVRMMTSNSKRVRQFYLEMTDVSLKPQLTKEGFELDESLEGSLKRRYSDYTVEVIKHGENFKAFKKDGGTGSQQMFREEVGKAFFKEVPHQNPHIAKAVKEWESFYEGIADELIELKMLPEDIKTSRDGARYLNRVWHKKKIKTNIPKFKKTITPYLRRQMVKIKNRLGGVANEVDEVGLPTKEALEARKDLSENFSEDSFDQYLKESVNSVTDNLVGANDFGFKPVVAGAKGPLKKRAFDIPDSEIQDYLNTDILFLSDRYVKQMVPEIEIRKRFGEVTFKDIAKEINEDYNTLIDATPGKSVKLHKERVSALADTETMWDLLKGTYRGYGGDPDGAIAQGAKGILTVNYVTKLGGVVESSMSDAAMGPLRRGFTNFFGHSLKPFIKDMIKTGGKTNKAQARAAGQSFEVENSSRIQSLFSVGDPMAASSTPFERFLASAGNKFSNINLINGWNDMWQRITYNGINFRIIDAVKTFGKKGKLNVKEEEWMNFVGLGKQDRIEIAKQLEKHGEIINDIDVPNLNNWTDTKMKNKYKAAISKETDRTIIIKSVADIPRFGNTMLGRMMFQWQNFNFAFNNKVIIAGMQEADGRILIGLGSLVSMGMVVEMVKSLHNDRPLPTTTAGWVEAGLNRSGIIGLLSYGNSFAKLGGFSYQELVKGEEGRPTQGEDFMKVFLGPSGRTFSDASRLTLSLGKAMRGEGFTKKDIHRFRTTFGYGQNLFYLTDLLDKLEEKAVANLPETRNNN